MYLREMTIDQLKDSIIRCNDRLASGNLGIMKIKERVIAAKSQYEQELMIRGVKLFDL